jgi:exosortase
MNGKIKRLEWTWKHVVGALIMMLLSIWVASQAWGDLVEIARKDEEASHVLLVPIAVAWLIWVRRGRLRQCRAEPSLLGTLIIAIGWATWSIGFWNNIQSMWHGGAVIMLIGAAITVLGKDVFFRFLPAFAVMVFLVPVPGRIRQEIALPLQSWTAQVTQGILSLFGVPVQVEGISLVLNGQQVNIAEACNGMRMVFTLVLVSYIFAFITPLRGYVRAIILVASPLTAIVCNVIRLIPTVWVFGHYSPEIAERFHDVSGWVMLVVAFLLLMSIVRVMRWAMVPVTEYTLASA